MIVVLVQRLPLLLASNHPYSAISFPFASVGKILKLAVTIPVPGLENKSIVSLNTSVSNAVSPAVGVVVPVPAAPWVKAASVSSAIASLSLVLYVLVSTIFIPPIRLLN